MSSIYERINAEEFKNTLPYSRTDPVIRSAYRIEEQRLNAEFASALLKEFGSPSWPESLRDLVYGLAWEHGHSAGYSDVASAYEDYARLAHAAFEAGQNSEEQAA